MMLTVSGNLAADVLEDNSGRKYKLQELLHAMEFGTGLHDHLVVHKHQYT